MNTTRRTFVRDSVVHCTGVALGASVVRTAQAQPVDPLAYDGPNVIVVRFGGGVRRLETINPDHTYSPYFLHELCKRGTLYTHMSIDQIEGLDTSHGEGTLNIITGKYGDYKDIGEKFLGQRFEPEVPTIFEYLRKSYAIPSHETLIVNGEDRTDEEFYTFSNHHNFGVDFRSNVLSLYRFKVFLLRRQIEEGVFQDEELERKKAELANLEAIDYRTGGDDRQSEAIEQFWEAWRLYYRDSGLVNPRGDQLLTELSLRAMKQLRPRLMMINYNDPDYVHWGIPAHYTRAISIIDQDIRKLVEFTERDEFYAGRTIFAIVPDCGRDDNPFAPVPFQHHFNSKAAHEIFALFFGPGVARNQVIDMPCRQIAVAPTIARLMNVTPTHTEADALSEVFA